MEENVASRRAEAWKSAGFGCSNGLELSQQGLVLFLGYELATTSCIQYMSEANRGADIGGATTVPNLPFASDIHSREFTAGLNGIRS